MIHDKLFLALLGASTAHAEASRAAFASLGLTEGQPKILYILKRQDGYVQKDLANVCGIRQSTLTVLIARMEEQNYIRRETCYVSGRKRAYKIYLTDEGRKKAEMLEEVVEELEERGFKGISKEDREHILKTLSKIEENMRL